MATGEYGQRRETMTVSWPVMLAVNDAYTSFEVIGLAVLQDRMHLVQIHQEDVMVVGQCSIAFSVSWQCVCFTNKTKQAINSGCPCIVVATWRHSFKQRKSV